jgi:hypothetical protein
MIRLGGSFYRLVAQVLRTGDGASLRRLFALFEVNERNGDITSRTTRWIVLVQTLSSGTAASLWAAWFSDWNYSIISASTSVTRIEYLANDS